MKVWKSPGVIGVTVLVAIILIVPTLIVIPFIGKYDAAVEVGNVSKQPLVQNEAEGPAVEVVVHRAKTKQQESVPLEDYVSRVVASEMPADFELEALKAQSLAARTYIIKHLLNGDALPSGADVTDTVEHQVYKNDKELRSLWGSDYEWKMEKIQQAVAATKGEVLTFEGEPITAAFFSTSNGETENAEDYWETPYPYLTSVSSPWDESSPKYHDQKVFTRAQIEERLGVQVTDSQPAFSEPVKTSTNRIKTVKVAGKDFTGRGIREALELQSADFTVVEKNGHYIFQTKGYGHGVGMSQYGANGMAQEGKTYDEIVSHFYQGTDVLQVSDFLPKLTASKE
ncbi:stage II sporulation protein D [Pontibacillus halophilus JSM 076056 = DSM 19796]|uniref:Stage II sporulation protein D n=1 Tax=Pontibacillus halophilus JSM 076056 = DSM 19796 TaxID=1385510 RepID=A0A0A5GRM7_9BACI|nr:stage II sporulation protein D [Pontibacillus halophilus]KGX93898.1 stage II sporulation protein D [Pontibacillus halophilus JSM 076056 = DSM 19796]